MIQTRQESRQGLLLLIVPARAHILRKLLPGSVIGADFPQGTFGADLFLANMLDVCNVLNQIGILKDEKAELVMKNHTMQCFDCLERLGYPIEKFLKEQEEES